MVSPVISLATEKVEISFSVNDFIVIGENLLTENETGQILEPFKGQHTGLDRLIDEDTLPIYSLLNGDTLDTGFQCIIR